MLQSTVARTPLRRSRMSGVGPAICCMGRLLPGRCPYRPPPSGLRAPAFRVLAASPRGADEFFDLVAVHHGRPPGAHPVRPGDEDEHWECRRRSAAAPCVQAAAPLSVPAHLGVRPRTRPRNQPTAQCGSSEGWCRYSFARNAGETRAPSRPGPVWLIKTSTPYVRSSSGDRNYRRMRSSAVMTAPMNSGFHSTWVVTKERTRSSRRAVAACSSTGSEVFTSLVRDSG